MILAGPRLLQDDSTDMSIVIVGASMNVADHDHGALDCKHKQPVPGKNVTVTHTNNGYSRGLC